VCDYQLAKGGAQEAPAEKEEALEEGGVRERRRREGGREGGREGRRVRRRE